MVPIDPRIWTRRVQVTRAQGRRRLRVLLGVSGVVAAVVGALVLLHSPLAAVRTVHVTGADHESSRAVEAAAGIVPGDTPIVDVDPHGTARRIGSLPWVASVTVARRWPWSLSIGVTERQPVAVVTRHQARIGPVPVLVDGTGRILGPADGTTSLPALVGTGGVPPVGGWMGRTARPALEVAAALPGSIRSGVAQIVAGPGGRLDLVLVGGVRVVLGAPTELPEKMEALVTMRNEVDVPNGSTIDLEVPGQPTVSG